MYIYIYVCHCHMIWIVWVSHGISTLMGFDHWLGGFLEDPPLSSAGLMSCAATRPLVPSHCLPILLGDNPSMAAGGLKEIGRDRGFNML